MICYKIVSLVDDKLLSLVYYGIKPKYVKEYKKGEITYPEENTYLFVFTDLDIAKKIFMFRTRALVMRGGCYRLSCYSC